MARISREKWKTWGNVFDEFTLRTLFKLSSEGHFERMESPLFIGKEANIFSALTKDGSRIVVKIYRLETCDFRRMYEYIRTDPRFSGLKRQRRKIIFAWAQREFRNLLLAREGGVRVPMPIAFENNVILMEFVGDDVIALKMKDSLPGKLGPFFNRTVNNMRKLYACGLVHSDLSEFNILNFHGEPVLIDMAQCTPKDDPNAGAYLKRDIRNIARFFVKKGLKTDEESLLKKVIWNTATR